MNTKATELEWRRLLEAIKLFKAKKPWRYLDETEIFVVKDPETGLEGYCCMVGPDGIHETFSVYLGAEGLHSYTKMVKLDQSKIWHPSYLKTLLGQKCLMLSFEDTNHLTQDEEKLYSNLDYKVVGKYPYPKFSEYESGLLPISFYSGWQCRFMTQALLQCLNVVDLILTKAINVSYELDDLLCFEFNEQRGWEYEYVSKQVLLGSKKQLYTYENDILTYKLRKSPQSHLVFEMIQFILAEPVRDLEHKRPYFPLITALIDRDSQDILFAEMGYSTPQSKGEMVGKIANFMVHDLQFRPKQISVDDEELIHLMLNLCEKGDIDLAFEDKLEVAYDFMKEILHNDDEAVESTRDETHQEQIDFMLSTTNQICELIVNSDSLCKNLTPYARSQFKNIVELLHVTMVGRFNEYDHEWTPENFKQAISVILPDLLYEEEMAVLPLILTEYLGILGQAGVMSNYKQFQEIVRDCKDCVSTLENDLIFT